jgi:hypothetical protein
VPARDTCVVQHNLTDRGIRTDAVLLRSLELGLLSSVALPAIAQADEIVQAAAPRGGVSPAEVALLTAPIIVYGTFSIYRDKVNPKAKVTDALFVLAGLAVAGNIVSILFFKTRLF